MSNFTEEMFQEKNLFYFYNRFNLVLFFEDDGGGFILDKNDNQEKMDWKINEEGILFIKSKKIQEAWKLKGIDDKNQEMIIESISKINGKKEKRKEIINFSENDIILPENKINYIKRMNKKSRIKLGAIFLFVFLFIFMILDNIFLIKDLNLMLKLLILVGIIIISKDKLFLFIIQSIKTNK